MTTLYKEKETCLVCGKTSEYTAVSSTNSSGAPDLDTRPPEMMRSIIPFLIRRCPSCGYCAPQVSKGPQRAKQIAQSEIYLRQISNQSYPELANSFLCWTMIQEAMSHYAGAGWAAVQAAWVCDDSNAREASNLCRSRAIQLFRYARANGDAFAHGAGVEEAIMADLLRRSGQLDQVEALCQEGLKRK